MMKSVFSFKMTGRKSTHKLGLKLVNVQFKSKWQNGCKFGNVCTWIGCRLGSVVATSSHRLDAG